jgi:hypothetical protein
VATKEEEQAVSVLMHGPAHMQLALGNINQESKTS